MHYFPRIFLLVGSRCSVVGWDTLLQAGRSRFIFQMRSLNFLIDLILPVAIWLWGRLSLLTKMSTANLSGGKGRPARKADNLTAICEPIVQKMWGAWRLTTLWAFTACYRDSFTFSFISSIYTFLVLFWHFSFLSIFLYFSPIIYTLFLLCLSFNLSLFLSSLSTSPYLLLFLFLFIFCTLKFLLVQPPPS
jgi:hypothetical protein